MVCQLEHVSQSRTRTLSFFSRVTKQGIGLLGGTIDAGEEHRAALLRHVARAPAEAKFKSKVKEAADNWLKGASLDGWQPPGSTVAGRLRAYACKAKQRTDAKRDVDLAFKRGQRVLLLKHAKAEGELQKAEEPFEGPYRIRAIAARASNT